MRGSDRKRQDADDIDETVAGHAEKVRLRLRDILGANYGESDAGKRRERNIFIEREVGLNEWRLFSRRT